MKASEFQIITAFLQHAPGGEDPTISGRSLRAVGEDERLRIRELASGELGQRQKDSLVQVLRTNPNALRMLADEIKSLRSGGAEHDAGESAD